METRFYFVVKVNFKNGDSRNIIVSDNKEFIDLWVDKNQVFYDNRLSIEEVEDNRMVVRFYSNTRRHYGKYQTIVCVSASIKDHFEGNILKSMKTCKFNTKEGVDSEAQRTYLLNKIKKQYGENIFCIY